MLLTQFLLTVYLSISGRFHQIKSSWTNNWALVILAKFSLGSSLEQSQHPVLVLTLEPDQLQ